MVKQGDIIKINLNPTLGHEQSGYRPAVVVSCNTFNDVCSMTILCPITNTDNQFPLHIPLENYSTTGFILCEQIKAVDIEARHYKVLERLRDGDLNKLISYIKSIFDIEQSD